MPKLEKVNYRYLFHKCIIIGAKQSYINKFEDETDKKLYSLLPPIVSAFSSDTNHPSKVLINGVYIPMYDFSIKKIGSECQNSNYMILILDDYCNEYYVKLSSEFNSNNIFWWNDKQTQIELSYREKYKNHQLDNIIVFRSGPHESEYFKGMDFSDNARALFEYMLSTRRNKKYHLVWIVNNPDDYRNKYINDNVEFISWNDTTTEDIAKRNHYYQIICTAKYFFFTDAYGFCRHARADQVRVQLWHGCGFKTRVNFIRCENRYEYNIVISDLYKKIHADIYGLRDDQVIVTGYPKEDWLFENHKNDYLKIFNIPKADKYIFWLPTFRSTGGKVNGLDVDKKSYATGLPIMETLDDLNELNHYLSLNNIIIVVKLHPFQITDDIVKGNFSNIQFISNESLYNNDVQINQLLTISHALISDYSSAAIDYLQLDRPIAFTICDLEEYEESRGFVFKPIDEWMPGAKIHNIDDLYRFIEEVKDGKDSTSELRHNLFHKLHSFNDGKSSERVCKAFNL
jgi:CDP-glycerol glycerophosphotransferase